MKKTNSVKGDLTSVIENLTTETTTRTTTDTRVTIFKIISNNYNVTGKEITSVCDIT